MKKKELKNFIEGRITNYSEGRNYPNILGTSKLSPFIKFGQIHVETIWDECVKQKIKGQDEYINEENKQKVIDLIRSYGLKYELIAYEGSHKIIEKELEKIAAGL